MICTQSLKDGLWDGRKQHQKIQHSSNELQTSLHTWVCLIHWINKNTARKETLKKRSWHLSSCRAREWSETGGSKLAVVQRFDGIYGTGHSEISVHIPCTRSAPYVEQSERQKALWGSLREASSRLFCQMLATLPQGLQTSEGSFQKLGSPTLSGGSLLCLSTPETPQGNLVPASPSGPPEGGFYGTGGKILFAEIKIRGT